MITLPKNVGLTIHYITPNSASIVSVEDMIDETHPLDWACPSERLMALKKQEYWTIRWLPNADADWCEAHASTLEALLDNVNTKHKD